MHNKLSHGFFSNNKALLSSTRTSYIIVKKKQALEYGCIGYGCMRNDLVRLGGYHTHRDVADTSYFFYFYFVFLYDQAE